LHVLFYIECYTASSICLKSVPIPRRTIVCDSDEISLPCEPNGCRKGDLLGLVSKSCENGDAMTETIEEGAPPAGGEIRTFLIADVRGYTRFTVEHGDEAAARLAAQFAAITRERRI
jgi:hypothetical protein